MKDKKKIIIVNNNMHVGGIQRALLNLLYEIRDDYEVTLFLFKKQGELLFLLPDKIKVAEAKGIVRIMGMSQQETRAEGLVLHLLRGINVLFSRLFTVRLPFFLLTHTQKIKEHFDYAVSYMQNPERGVFYGGCNEFVLNSIDADMKIAFIHCDYSNYGGNYGYNVEICKKFDKIAACSEGCRTSFVSAVSGIEDKTYAVHNCYNYKEIKELAKEYKPEYPKNTVNLLTVARLSEEKGVLRMLDVLRTLKGSGIKFLWHVVGGGKQQEEFAEKVKAHDLADYVVQHGETANPYPHFMAADLLVVPSYNEAAPMVFGEAEICGLPVLSTETTSADELVASRGIGWVCENNDSALATALKNILVNSEMLAEKKQTMNKTKIDNSVAVEEFEKLLEIKRESVEVLCSAMKLSDYSISESLNLQTDAVIINQCDKNEYSEYSFRNKKVRMYSMTERGIGRSRNCALMHATGDILIFADDDVRYTDGYEQLVLSEFSKRPKADMLLFNIDCHGGNRKEFVIKKEGRVNLHNCLRYGAVRIAVKREALLRCNCYFSLLFGGGAPYSAGEDNIFITDCLKKGMRIYSCKKVLCSVDMSDSTWFCGYNEKYFSDKGVLMYSIYGGMAYLYILPVLLKQYLRQKDSFSLRKAVKASYRAISQFKKGDKVKK